MIGNVNACNASFNPSTAMLASQPLRCVSDVDTGDTCLSGAQIAGYNETNTAWTLNYTLASGETTYPGFNTWGTDFGNPGTSPLQPTVLTLSLGTEQPANPMPAVKPATTTTIAISHQPTGYGPCNSIGSVSAPAWVRPD